MRGAKAKKNEVYVSFSLFCTIVNICRDSGMTLQRFFLTIMYEFIVFKNIQLSSRGQFLTYNRGENNHKWPLKETYFPQCISPAEIVFIKQKNLYFTKIGAK